MNSAGSSDSLGAEVTEGLVLSKDVVRRGISAKFEPAIMELLKHRFSLLVGTFVENKVSL